MSRRLKHPASVRRQMRMLRPTWWRPVTWATIAKLWPGQHHTIGMSYWLWQQGIDPPHSINLFHMSAYTIKRKLGIDIPSYIRQR
jgi:hypothetical protein